MKNAFRFSLFAALVLCASASIAACSSNGDTSSEPASCPQSFYVDADGSGLSAGPLPNDQCDKLCAQAVFSCSVAEVDAGKASIECQPSCTQ